MTSPHGGREGGKKTAIWGDFQGLTGVTRGGRGVKFLENWGDVIYGWSLSLCVKYVVFTAKL